MQVENETNLTEAIIRAEYGDKWPNCKYCKRKATRYHARHDTGKLENLCEKHYSKWHPESAKWTPKKEGQNDENRT